MKKRCPLWIVVSALALTACGGAGTEPALFEEAPGDPVPPPEGWSISEGPTSYTAESLFEYLNGGAPMYLDYGFLDLTQTRYQLGKDPFATVTLDVYDMGSELGAFGVFRKILPPGAGLEDWGVEGYRSGTIAAAWRGSVYVQGEADDERPELIDVLEGLVSSAVEAGEGRDALPAVLEVLPADGLVPGSERFNARDLFGHAFLPGAIVADYDIDGVQATLFFCELEDAAGAEDALERWRAHQQEWGEIGPEISDLGDGGFRFIDSGLGDGTIVRLGDVIAGVHGPADADHLFRGLLVNLRRDAP